MTSHVIVTVSISAGDRSLPVNSTFDGNAFVIENRKTASPLLARPVSVTFFFAPASPWSTSSCHAAISMFRVAERRKTTAFLLLGFAPESTALESETSSLNTAISWPSIASTKLVALTTVAPGAGGFLGAGASA